MGIGDGASGLGASIPSSPTSTATFRVEGCSQPEVDRECSRQLRLDTAPILRYVEQFLMKTTVWREADNERLISKTKWAACLQNALEHPTTFPQAFYE